MALSYRSPIEEVYTSFTTSEQSLISSIAVQHYRDLEEKNFTSFNFDIKAAAKEKLIDSGIYLSPFSGVPHSHPVCKTLENYMLYSVLPSYIDDSFYFVGIKDHKLNFLKSRDKSMSLVGQINRYVTSADKFRYPTVFHVRASARLPAAEAGGYLSDCDTLRDLLPSCLTVKARKFFFHDELHYWKLEELKCFLQVVKPDTMLGTIVYPPELLIGCKESLNPWCYDFETSGEDFTFYPDGVRSEGYTQPLSGGYLLRASQIVLEDGTIYGVELIHSKFSHHLIGLTKGKLRGRKSVSFGNFCATSYNGLSKVSKDIGPCLPISFTVVSKVYRYLRTLQKPDRQSAMAKLSQIVPEPTAFEAKFILEFSDFVINHGWIKSILTVDLWQKFKASMLGLFPKCYAQSFKLLREMSLDEFASSMKPYTFTLPAIVMRRTSDFSIHKDIQFESVAEDFDGDTIQKLWEGEARWAFLSREAQPYTGGACYLEISIDEKAQARVIARYIVNSFLNANIVRVSRDFIKRQIRNLRTFKRSSGGVPLFISFIVDIESLISRVRLEINARAIHKLRVYFSKLGLDWFVRLKNWRGYQNYLVEREWQPSACIDVKGMWSKVCQEIAKGAVVEPKVASNIPEQGMPVASAPQPLTTTDTTSIEVDPVVEPAAVIAEADCGCGLSLPVSTVVGCDYVLPEFPDVLKGRSGGWYTKDCRTAYRYNGGYHESLGWPEWIDLFLECNGIDNEYDCMLAQKYSAGASIGLHADDEEIFEFGSSVLTINVSGSCNFKIKCAKGQNEFPFDAARSFVMPNGFQQTHKHSVSKCTEGRVSFTFRKLRHAELAREEPATTETDETVTSEGQPFVDYELFGVTCLVQPILNEMEHTIVDVAGDGSCFYHCLGEVMGVDGLTLRHVTGIRAGTTLPHNEELARQLEPPTYSESEAIAAFSRLHQVRIHIYDVDNSILTKFVPRHCTLKVSLRLSKEHFQLMVPSSDCVLVAIGKALNREKGAILKVICRDENMSFYDELSEGYGLGLELLHGIFSIFDISARIDCDGEFIAINPTGKHEHCFVIRGNHMTYSGRLHLDNVAPGAITSGKAPTSAIQILNKAGCDIQYVIERCRAEQFARALHNGDTGVLCCKLFNSRELIETGHFPERQVRRICVIVGVFGSGKSTLFKNFFSKVAGKRVTFVSPRRVLAEAIRAEVLTQGARDKATRAREKNWKIQTFEAFVLGIKHVSRSHVVIFDEIQLYPPGYLDLVLGKIPMEVEVFCAGDPCQSNYDSERDRMIYSKTVSDIKHALDGVEYCYATTSRRFKNRDFSGRLPCVFEGEWLVDEAPLMAHGLDELARVEGKYRAHVLVPGFSDKVAIKAIFGQGCDVLTYGESTGCTFDYYTLVVNESARHVDEERWVTAITRGSHGIAIANMLECPNEYLHEVFQDRVFGKFLRKKSEVGDLLHILPGNPKFKQFLTPRIGRDEGVKEAKLAGDPWLKTQIFLGQEEDMEAIDFAEGVAAEPLFKTHIPRCELEGVRSQWVHKLLLRELREKRMGSLVSEQFADDHSKNRGQQLTNAAERFESIYPRHKGSDTVTFIMACRKRLRFSKPTVERAKLNEATMFGEFMLQEFLKKVPLKPQHNKQFMERAVRNFEEKKTSKSAAIIENHAGRSCSDWLADSGLVFMKSQHCTKFGNRFIKAKAAQTIVCFQHSVLCRFAPYMRYIEMKVHEVLPQNYYIHSGKSLDTLSEWVKRYRFEGKCTESDYEAFDASQDQYIMAFELALMKFLGLPKDLIMDYIYIKTHLGSKLGSFAIMRFSGEASTFLFNTLANMLFTFLRYDLNGSEAICFAGDDMCASSRLRYSTKYDDFLGRLKLKAKVDFTDKPTFCGWNLCSDGIYKKPQLVFERMCIAKETNNLSSCIDNYAIEVSYAYRMGERSVNRMDAEELQSYYNCIRIIIRNKHLLKSDVRGVFENSIP